MINGFCQLAQCCLLLRRDAARADHTVREGVDDALPEPPRPSAAKHRQAAPRGVFFDPQSVL